MNKKLFLAELYKYLGGLTEDERQDIMYDYEEHFRLGMQEGKDEQTIAKELGSPLAIARQYLPVDAAVVSKQSSGARSALVFLALLVFNVVIVLGPALGLLGAIIGLAGAAIGLVIGGVTLIAVLIFPFIPAHYVALPAFIFDNAVASGMLGLGISCLGLLLLIAVFYIVKGVMILFSRYVRWNVETIRG